MAATAAETLPLFTDVEELPAPPRRPSLSRSPPSVAEVTVEGPCLPLDDPVLAWLSHRLSPGEATLLVGPARAVEPLLEVVYAGCVRAGGSVSLVEGANRFHPYRLAERGRQSGLESNSFLGHIRLARAFTAYQLVALVEEWASEVRRHAPTLLVGHELPLLFSGDELPEEERVPLLTHVARQLRRLLATCRLPLLLTVEEGITAFPGLAKEGPRLFDLVRLLPRPGGLLAEAYREVARLRLVPRDPGQPGLESFHGDSLTEEVVAWGAPRPRTGRRSKSG